MLGLCVTNELVLLWMEWAAFGDGIYYVWRIFEFLVSIREYCISVLIQPTLFFYVSRRADVGSVRM